MEKDRKREKVYKMSKGDNQVAYKPGNKKLNLRLMEEFDMSKLLPHPVRDAEKIHRFTQAFEIAILRQVRLGGMAIHLSGGLDTRAILAVLVKHNIEVDALTFYNDDDVILAMELKNICPNIKKLQVFNSRASMEDYYEDLKYSVILSGSCMTELWEYYQYVSKKTKHEGFMYKIARDMQRTKDANIYYPALDDEVISALRQLPRWWRKNKRLQLHIIREFCPRLVQDVEHDMPKLPLFLGIFRNRNQRFRHTRDNKIIKVPLL